MRLFIHQPLSGQSHEFLQLYDHLSHVTSPRSVRITLPAEKLAA